MGDRIPPRRNVSPAAQWTVTVTVMLPALGLSAGLGWRLFSWVAGL